MKINEEKTIIISSYLADNIKDLYLTKLFKLFYYIDFIAMNERGAPITNDLYYKLPYGPVPSFIKNEIDSLLLRENSEEYGSIFFKNLTCGLIKDKEFKAVLLKKKKDYFYSLRDFSQYERNLLGRIVKKFKNTSSAVLSKKTHKEKPYLLTSDNSIIDYSLATELNPKEILS